MQVNTNRSSRPEVFCKKAVLRNFTNFTGKQLCQSLFFNKVEGLGQGNEKTKQDKNIRKGKKTKWRNFFWRGLF